MKKEKQIVLSILPDRVLLSDFKKGDYFTNHKTSPTVCWRVTSSGSRSLRASCFRLSDGVYYSNSSFSFVDFYSGLPDRFYPCEIK